MRVQTQSIHFDADVKLIDFIEQRLSKLEKFYDQIIIADVKLRLENNGQVRDKVAEIILEVPGSTLVAKDSDKSFEVAIDSTIEALRRQLKKHKERTRT